MCHAHTHREVINEHTIHGPKKDSFRSKKDSFDHGFWLSLYLDEDTTEPINLSIGIVNLTSLMKPMTP